MIKETLMALQNIDVRIHLILQQISQSQTLRGRAYQNASTPGIGRPTEKCAIGLAELEDRLAEIKSEREQVYRLLEKEKAACADELVWSLLWDHFYLGYTWKKTAARHGMKESAAKMRALRYLKNSENMPAPDTAN